MQKTINYQLNQWEASDSIRREDFNESNAAIDAAIKAVADTAASKAGAEELAAVSQSVAALTSALGSGGQTCRIASGSYTGNGKYGSANPVTLSAPFYPMVVIWGNTENYEYNTWPTVLMRGVNGGHYDCGEEGMVVTWKNNSVSCYSTAAYSQNNTNGTKYQYVILGYSV